MSARRGWSHPRWGGELTLGTTELARAPEAVLSWPRILWRDFPILNFALYAIFIAHAELASLPAARPDLVPTFVFPWVACLAFYTLRGRRASGRERWIGAAVCAAVPALIGLTYVTGNRTVFTHEELRNIYEVSSILNTVILMAHATRYGKAALVFFLGPAALYGLLLENGGILLGYFTEMNYRWYLGPLPAPLATMSGWITVFYLVTWVTWQVRKELPVLQRSALASAGVATVAALLLDLQIDPLATTVGYWKWHPILHEGFMGVPILNFVAWACAVFPFAHVLFWRENSFGLQEADVLQSQHRRWLTRRVLPILAYAGVLFVGCMIAFEGGVTGPTFKILHQTAAGHGLIAPDHQWAPGSP